MGKKSELKAKIASLEAKKDKLNRKHSALEPGAKKEKLEKAYEDIGAEIDNLKLELGKMKATKKIKLFIRNLESLVQKMNPLKIKFANI